MADIGWEGAVSILCVVTALVVLFKDWAGADFVFLGGCDLADRSDALLSRCSVDSDGHADHLCRRRSGWVLKRSSFDCSWSVQLFCLFMTDFCSFVCCGYGDI